jgi:hypothetical protein
MGYIAVYDRIAPATNKFMATLWNGATGRVVIVNRVYRLSHNVTAIVGVLLEQELRFITARTAGTTITPVTEDTNDTLTAGIVADHASTAVTEGTGTRGLIRRFFATAEETSLTELTNSPEGAASFLHDGQIIYWKPQGGRGLVLRNGQGLTIKNLTASTIGTVSYVFEFDDQVA